jgi:hypothetical protein
VLLDCSLNRPVEPEQPQPYVFDVESLGGRGRADDVGEERGNCPALLEGRRDSNRCSTRGTEPRVAPGGRTARPADGLSSSVRRFLLKSAPMRRW